MQMNNNYKGEITCISGDIKLKSLETVLGLVDDYVDVLEAINSNDKPEECVAYCEADVKASYEFWQFLKEREGTNMTVDTIIDREVELVNQSTEENEADYHKNIVNLLTELKKWRNLPDMLDDLTPRDKNNSYYDGINDVHSLITKEIC